MPFRSLQSKLIASFVGVTAVSLALASGFFVANQRDSEEQRELDRLAAASGAITNEYSGTPVNDTADLLRFAVQAAERYRVRVLLVDGDGEVTADSGSALAGSRITFPEAARKVMAAGGYVTWSPPGGTPGSGLTLLSTSSGFDHHERRGLPFERPTAPVGSQPPGGPADYSLLLGVPQSTLSNAWLDLLPGLSIAAAVAMAAAVGLAVLLARYITRPVKRLTAAAESVSAGRFDVDIETRRDDEIGRLGRTFSSMADRVGRSQTEMRALVADISHDLKTPLTSVIGFAQALKTGAADDLGAAQRMGSIIYQEAERLAHRLDDLLYLSEVDSPQLELALTRVDTAALLRSLASRSFPADGSGPEIILDVAGGPMISADSGRLERALENLAGNARKYTPPGGQVRLAALPSEAPWAVQLLFANPAPAVSQEELALFTRRFYRGDRNRADGNGSGLGLAIAHDIIARHGGELRLSLEDGDFVARVLLPAVPPAQPGA